MKRKLILLICSLSLVLVLTPIALAVGGEMSGGRRNSTSDPGCTWVPLVEKLNLSDQQAQQLKELNLSTYQTTKPLKARMHEARFELRQLGLEKNADKAAVNAKIKEINDLCAQLHKIHQQKHEKMKTILTPEQQSKLKDMKGFGQHGGRNYKGGTQLSS